MLILQLINDIFRHRRPPIRAEWGCGESVCIKKVAITGVISPRVTYSFRLGHGWRAYDNGFSFNLRLGRMELLVGACDFKPDKIRRSFRCQPAVHMVEVYRRLRPFNLELFENRATVHNILPVTV